MITENIVSRKNVVKDGKDLVLVTTESGAEVWAPKAQLNDAAETVSFNAHKKGSKWSNPKTGATGERREDTNEYLGCGRINKFAILDYLKSQGVTPTFSLG
jgi:hypothetical protein